MLYYPVTKTELSKAVTLAQAKEQLNILPSETTDDAFITSLIDRGTKIAERFIEKDINETESEVVLKAQTKMRLQDGYIKSIVSVETVETTPVSVSISDVKFWSDFGEFTIDDVTTDQVTVKYNTGWAAADLPADIRQAILLQVAYLYDVDRNNTTMNNVRSTEHFETVLRYHKKLIL